MIEFVILQLTLEKLRRWRESPLAKSKSRFCSFIKECSNYYVLMGAMVLIFPLIGRSLCPMFIRVRQ